MTDSLYNIRCLNGELILQTQSICSMVTEESRIFMEHPVEINVVSIFGESSSKLAIIQGESLPTY